MKKSNRYTRRQLLTAVAGLAAAGATTDRGSAQAARPPALRSETAQFVEFRRGAELPPVRLQRIDGSFVDLSTFRGKSVLVNFWATWCAPCRRELPLLERLRRTIDSSLLEIVPVSIDRTPSADVSAFLKRLDIRTLRTYHDPQGHIARGANEGVDAPFILYGMPVSYIIDRQGRVAGYVTGELDWTSSDALALLAHYRQT